MTMDERMMNLLTDILEEDGNNVGEIIIDRILPSSVSGEGRQSEMIITIRYGKKDHEYAE